MRIRPEPENPLFSQIFFEHGYLPCYRTYLLDNLCVCCLDTYGGKSQHFDTRLGFCFIVCRRWKFEKKLQKITKVSGSFCRKKKN